ncbi:unnamed protein product [Mycena citricolor]|uniref:PEHE domain-containing protein n=1 Tax=Mycena citricolor TaxID=2018698 RepID=A0AAD2GWE2_9AGAR|nr:unnamed protein product [Mycena citricolor]
MSSTLAMDDNEASLRAASGFFPQKRVQPSRIRRGGPGVGNCDVDMMILNFQSNKSDGDPIIPSRTPFYLTTDPTLGRIATQFAGSASSSSGISLPAHESYFDRPEVIQSYREQTLIETPEFSRIDEHMVAARLRRSSHDDVLVHAADDSVYEKRHKKYEAFEKRNRLREREKLKHEQYKLKERIEQLRAMENSAFLAAPDSSFSPQPPDEELERDPDLLPFMGNTSVLEGERRRKEMLTTAVALEERYRLLLPPDRARKALNASNDGEADLAYKDSTRPNDEMEIWEGSPAASKLPTRVTLKLGSKSGNFTPGIATPKSTSPSKKRRRSSVQPEAGSSNVVSDNFQLYDPEAAQKHRRPRKPVKRRKMDEDSPVSGLEEQPDHEPFQFVPPPTEFLRTSSSSLLDSTSPESQEIDMLRVVPSRGKGKVVRESSAPPIEAIVGTFSPVRPAKRTKGSSSAALPLRSISRKRAGQRRPSKCGLVIYAERASKNPRQLQQARRLEAFGCKLPKILEDPYNFELPEEICKPNIAALPDDDIDADELEDDALSDDALSDLEDTTMDCADPGDDQDEEVS